MAIINKFEGRRSRGIVWVCDIESSAKYLNSNKSAEALETFLQRFLFMSLIFVEAAGGTFIKWTGDGFLAWFETPLHRDIGSVASGVFNAAWTLSFYVNVSQLNVKADIKFKIRHAVTFEHDALVIDLSHSNDKSSTDVLGRAVVLAFRLSAIRGEFPSIVTQRELVRAATDKGTITFKKLTFSRDEKLKYFKDESWGISDIFISSERRRRSRGLRNVLKQTKLAIAHAESNKPKEEHVDFYTRIVHEMAAGPVWCKQVQVTMDDFSRDSLLGKLKKIVPVMEEQAFASTDAPKMGAVKPPA